jgi:prepilin-type N-terminal cleavage/methylation domain-containing protein
MNHPPIVIVDARHGFTLIELMISIALGSLIVYTAVAGFRVASQSFTVVNQISRETALIRSGLQQVHERIDFWADCDDPDDPAQQKLRTKSTAWDANSNMVGHINAAINNPDPDMRFETGLPFSPMNDVVVSGGPLKKGVFPNKLVPASPEKSTGWNPKELWFPNDARTWFHGDYADKRSGINTAGFSTIYANIKNQITIYANPANNNWTLGSAGLTNYGTVSPPYNWFMNQVWGMHAALGYYGFVDYMPPNTIYNAYGTPHDPTKSVNYYGTDYNGSILGIMGDHTKFTQTDENVAYWYGRDVTRATFGGAFAIISPKLTDSPPTNLVINSCQNYMAHQFKFAIGNRAEYNGSLGRTVGGPASWQDRVLQYKDFIDKTEVLEKVINNGGPAAWSKVDVVVKRIVFRARFTNICSVRWTNPLSGKSAELNFTAFGTSLRGARQQRKEDSGWAKWYGPSDSLPSGQRNDTTLDGDL